MGLSKAEVKLRRLLAAMPNQDNSRKLVHYVATARELLTVLTGENAQQNLPSVSADKAKEYAERIEAFAEKLNITQMPDLWDALDATCRSQEEYEVPASSSSSLSSDKKLRKRHPQAQHPEESRASEEVKLDSATQGYIAKHRRLQDDLTDEMVVFARHIKESTLLMEQSLRDTDKVLDSTGDAVERSLAATDRATRRAGEVYSRGFMTGCYTWLLIFAMFCVFIFMIAIIRVT